MIVQVFDNATLFALQKGGVSTCTRWLSGDPPCLIVAQSIDGDPDACVFPDKAVYDTLDMATRSAVDAARGRRSVTVQQVIDGAVRGSIPLEDQTRSEDDKMLKRINDDARDQLKEQAEELANATKRDRSSNDDVQSSSKDGERFKPPFSHN